MARNSHINNDNDVILSFCSAVSACSESRDRILKFGRSHFRLHVISGRVGWLSTRPRYSCSAARLCIQPRDKGKKSWRGRSKSISFSSGVTFAVLAVLTLEASQFLGKYESHANETAIQMVSVFWSDFCRIRVTFLRISSFDS